MSHKVPIMSCEVGKAYPRHLVEEGHKLKGSSTHCLTVDYCYIFIDLFNGVGGGFDVMTIDCLVHKFIV